MFPPRDVIEEHHLCVLICFDLHSLSAITRWILVWVYIYNLPVSFISEEKTCIRVSIHSEIRGIIKSTVLSIPVVIREI